MRPVPLTFLLSDHTTGSDLIHELNLHDDVVARLDDDVLVVECPDTPRIRWDVKSTVTLFDATAREVIS